MFVAVTIVGSLYFFLALLLFVVIADFLIERYRQPTKKEVWLSTIVHTVANYSDVETIGVDADGSKEFRVWKTSAQTPWRWM